MRFYRFEVAKTGETQGEGFLQGIDEVGLDSKTFLSLVDPFETLPNPYLDEPFGVKFFFTEEGLKKFMPHINAFVKVLKPLGWSLLGFVLSEDDYAESVYHDAYQVAWTRDSLGPLGPGYPVEDAEELLSKPIITRRDVSLCARKSLQLTPRQLDSQRMTSCCS